jgi:putative salt-induced outer membrane protein YdiY
MNPEVIIKALTLTRRLACAIAITQFGLAASLDAQADEVPDRWKVSAELSFTDQSGNRVLRLLTGGINVSHLEQESYRLDASIQSRYGRTDGELVARNHQASLAFDFRPTSAWSPFLFTDVERDEFKRLDIRLSSGAGAKHTLRRSSDGDQETSISLALLHAFEQVAAPPPEEPEMLTGPVVRSHRARWSLRGRTSHQLRDGVTFRHTTYYQPIWGELADYLLRSDTGLKILLTERLALAVEYQLKRDARPPEGVHPNDRLLTTGLIIDF